MHYYAHLRRHFTDRSFLISLSIALFLFFIALTLNYFASTYATKEASSSVTDIILSNTRVYDVGHFFSIGTFLTILFVFFIALQKLNRIPFMMEATALFVVIRSVFITLTHIAPFPTQVIITSDIYARFNFGGDLFFSGHTGLPFLMALIFWETKTLRYIFLLISIFFAVVVLLGHIHYSIDVFSAYFISYAIYHIAIKLFSHDFCTLKDGVLL